MTASFKSKSKSQQGRVDSAIGWWSLALVAVGLTLLAVGLISFAPH